MDSDELHDCTAALLTEQLALVRRQIHETLDGLTRQVPRHLAHRELCDRAALHAQARDEIVLPVVRAAQSEAVTDILGQQQCLKDALAMCLIRPTSHPQWRNALQALLEAVQQQLAGDVTLLDPLLKEATDATQQRLLCERLQERFDRLAPHRHANAHLRLAKTIWPVQAPDRTWISASPTRHPNPPPRDAAFSP